MRVFLTILSALIFSNTVIANTVYDAAKNAGIETCLEQIQQVSDFKLEDSDHASHDMWSSSDVDDKTWASLAVKQYSDGDSHIVITSAPTSDGGCETQMTETFAQESRCMALRENWYPELEVAGNLAEDTFVLASDGNLHIYLTPTETGANCLVTTREVIR